jgi:hypothetical protein
MVGQAASGSVYRGIVGGGHRRADYAVFSDGVTAPMKMAFMNEGLADSTGSGAIPNYQLRGRGSSSAGRQW